MVLFDDDTGEIIEDANIIRNALGTGVGTFKVLEFVSEYFDPSKDRKERRRGVAFLDDQSVEETETWEDDISNIEDIKVWDKTDDCQWQKTYVSWYIPDQIERYRIREASKDEDEELREQRQMFKRKWVEDNFEEVDTEMGSAQINTSERSWN